MPARASRAFDHDPATAWTPENGNSLGSWIDVATPSARTVDSIRLTLVADQKHSVPTQLTLYADGQPARTLPLPHVTSGKRDGTLRTVDVSFDPVTAKDFRIQIGAVRTRTAAFAPGYGRELLPVSIAEAGIADVPVPANPTTVDSGCRGDLVTVDDRPVPVEIRGATDAAASSLDVEACSPTLPMTAGSHTLQTATSSVSGFAVDRVVLSSDRAGQPAAVTPAGAPASTSGARVTVTSSTPDSYHLKVHTDGTPFWLVLGQSHNDGWEATIDGRSLGSPQLVNGFANGWTVRPGSAGTVDIVLRWTPQRTVWIGLGISAFAVLVCLGLVFARRRRPVTSRGPELFDVPTEASPFAFDGATPAISARFGAAATAAIVTALVSRWWIGLLVGAAILLTARVTRGRLLLAGGAPVALALGALFGVPELGWVAIGLLIGDLVAGWWWQRRPDDA